MKRNTKKIIERHPVRKCGRQPRTEGWKDCFLWVLVCEAQYDAFLIIPGNN